MSELLSAADEEGIRIQDVKVRRKERQRERILLHRHRSNSAKMLIRFHARQ